MRADKRSDIFWLGAVLFEMLTGERLFTGDTTAEILERVVAGEIPRRARSTPRSPRRSRRSSRARSSGLGAPLPLRGRDGRGLRALPLRQGLRAHQPHAEAVPGLDLRRQRRTTRPSRASTSRRSCRCATRCARSPRRRHHDPGGLPARARGGARHDAASRRPAHAGGTSEAVVAPRQGQEIAPGLQSAIR